MKRPFLFSFIILSALFLCRCGPDDTVISPNEPVPDPDDPGINMITKNISTAPGHYFWVRATITDDVGLKKVNLLKLDWYLDKDIILSDSTRTEYNLLYKFMTPEDAVDDNHTLLLSVEDAEGNITTRELPILFSKDGESKHSQ